MIKKRRAGRRRGTRKYCIACGGMITEERRRLSPTTITCKGSCSDEHTEELRRQASLRYYHRNRDEINRKKKEARDAKRKEKEGG